MRSIASRVLPALAVTSLVMSLGACAAGEGPDGTGVTGLARSGSTTDAQHSGLTAAVDQGRMDVAADQIFVRLTNISSSAVTLRQVRLTSTGFTRPMAYDRSGIVVEPGRAVDLRVGLSAAACAGVPLEHEVQVEVELDDGQVETLLLPAVDVDGRIAALHAAQCFAADADAVATLSVVGPPRERDLGGDLAADLVVGVTPHGGPGSLELVRVHNTTLLQLLDPVTGARQGDGYPIAVVVAGDDAPREIRLTVVPARCDAHAVADDKQGTRFRFDVTLDGREGIVGLTAPTEVTTALYDFAQRACGGSG